MTDLETVADALDVDEETLAAFVDDDTTPAAVLGRFPDADLEYSEARALVEAWLGGAPARVSGPDRGAAGDAHADGEGDDPESRGDDRADPSGSAEGEAHDEREPITEANSNGGDDDRRDTSGGGRKQTETPDGGGTTDAGDDAGTGTPDDSSGYRPTYGAWSTAAFDDPAPDTYPPALLEREQWMGHVEKMPFAPWSDRDHPEAEPDDDARWKWGLEENYVDGETVAIGETDPRLDGRVFLQREADPFAFVDGDDVRDPETGAVHPAFVALLEHLGLTYADVSTSGAGVHAYYRGELPLDDKGQATFPIDTEPFGANDSAPTVEIYANKHVCVATGEHVPGTGTDVAEWNADALAPILEANGYGGEEEPLEHDTDRDRSELEDYTPDATGADDTTDDVRDVLAAVDALQPRDLPLRTRQVETDGTGWEKWDPGSYRSTDEHDSLHTPDREVFYDHKKGETFGVLKLFALEEGILSRPGERLAGGDWWEAVDAAREAGAPIPEYVGSRGDAEPVAALPLARLQALDDGEAERFARDRAVEWPDTETVREELQATVRGLMRDGEKAVVDAPTGAGKSHQAATTAWRDTDAAGGAPVIHFHETKDARDEHLAASRDAEGVDCRSLLAGPEACPVAGGRHDPETVADVDEERQVVTVDGEPASEWIRTMTRGRGVPFSVAHVEMIRRNDQGLTREEFPCCPGEQMCHSGAQWAGVPRDDDGEPTADIIHATHEFARVPSLRQNVNGILDERPNFAAGLNHDRARRAVTAFLGESGGGPDTWEELVATALDMPGNPFDGATGRDVPGGGRMNDARDRFMACVEALEHDPETEWYFREPDAHTLAAPVAQAVFRALVPADPFDANGRATHRTKHHPPRFDDDARDDDFWNREWVTVVVDDTNEIRKIRSTPDFSGARSVVGLDARPNTRLWRRNVAPSMTREPVLEPDERRLWRVFERSLRVVQVGDAVRPKGRNGQYYDRDGDAALVEKIRERFGDLRSGVVPKDVESEYREILEAHGADAPDVLTFGSEKSRNDLAGESVGMVSHSLDPGDEHLLDLLAECELEATPERVACGTCDGTGDVDGERCEACDGDGEHRAHGRGFDGPDADAAAGFLATVRENHLVQSAGRYARNPEDPDDGATVFVRSSALPEEYVDLQVPGVEWLATDRQARIVEALQQREHATAAELADAADVSKEHVRTTLQRLVDADAELVECREEAGEHGAHLYRALAGLGTEPAVVDTTPEETANGGVWETSTWSLAVSPGFTLPEPPTAPDQPTLAAFGPGSGPSAAADPGADPPDPAD